MKDKFIEKLEERYRKGEISRETYEEILQRYQEEKRKNESTAEEIEKAINRGIISVGGEEDSRRDYKCAGSCVIGSGIYGVISVAGSIKINGDIKAIKVAASGSLHATGNIIAGQFKSAGSAKIEGSLNAEECSVAGFISSSSFEGKKFSAGGAIVCQIITADDVKIGGSIKCEKIKGKRIEIKLDGKSTVDEVEGEEIEIRSRMGILRKCRGSAKIKKISGVNVEIDCVEVEEVHGKIVRIGDNCEVNLVEGEDVKISKSAKVEKVIKRRFSGK